MAKRDLRSSILQAAERVVHRSGMASTTTKEVAAEAGCSQGSLYNHFRDRADLLANVVMARMDAERHEMEAVAARLEGEDEPGALVALLTALLDADAALIGLSAPLLGDSEVLDRFRAIAAETGLRGPHVVVGEYVERRRAAGVFRSDADPAAAALALGGAVHQLALERHLEGGTSSPTGRAAVEPIAALVYEGLSSVPRRR